jgi:acyl carrier protein
MDAVNNRDAEYLMSWLQNCISEASGVPLSAVGRDEDFEQFGIDSAGAVSIVMDLEEEAGLETELEPEVLFEFRTIRGLVEHVESLRLAALKAS